LTDLVLGRVQDGSRLLNVDHREVDALFADLETQPVGDARRRELADEVTAELVRHTVARDLLTSRGSD
jgi:hypothetical protein